MKQIDKESGALMSEHQPDQARFDHVDETGGLVFAVGDARFVVRVDDTLEHAILEAKQVTSEINPVRRPAGQSIPISQIQSLIRAGADPSRVAERYGLSDALVRRFSATVETEKQYAIDQFLSVPAPKDSRMHTVSEMIERTLAAARVRPEDMQWQATRRGLEPWRITAQFVSAGRTMRAEWTWNMHDNSIACLNRTAKTLISDMSTSKQKNTDKTPRSARTDNEDDGFNIPLDLPGDSVRSARIEQVVSSWAAPEPTLPAARPDRNNASSSVKKTSAHNAAHNASATADADSSRHRSATADTASTVDDSSAGNDAKSSSDTPNASVGDHAAETTESRQNTAHTAKSNRRKSGRSAVPSWDEILFGD